VHELLHIVYPEQEEDETYAEYESSIDLLSKIKIQNERRK